MTNEWLDPDKIKSKIALKNQHALVRLDVFDTIDSTNTYLLSQAKAGAPSGTVCFAEQQTQGRGRRGRSWFSPPGTNIYCSMLWRFYELDAISGLSIAVAVILMDVLKKYGVPEGIQIKWPNDLLFSGRKLAGILLERNDTGVVIGIGLNLYLPDNSDPNWIALQEIMGQPISRNSLAGLLVNELLEQLAIYQASGLLPFLKKWKSYDALINQMISVHTPDSVFSGVMSGVNEKGELLLLDNEGRMQTFCYGEVSCRWI